MNTRLLSAALLVALTCSTAPLSAVVELASPFSSHMVLQRGKPVPVWGSADPGERVTVSFAGQQIATTAGTDGKWRVDLAPLTASAVGRVFTVAGSATPAPLALADVLVGEVWIGSGQSNMDFTVSTERYAWAGVDNMEQEIAAANHPLVRMFKPNAVRAYEPADRIAGTWQVCSPETVGDFSAVGYFFARDLQRELGVPVGVIVVSYGATTAHAWLRREAFEADPQLKPVLERFDEQMRSYVPPSDEVVQAWEKSAAEARAAGTRVPPRPGQSPLQNQRNPTVMFNGTVAPVVPYATRGFLWYQGESITAPRELFPRFNEALVRDWRVLWNDDSLPFFFCQLAALRANSNSPEVRSWQAEALSIPHTGMVTTIDIGDERDVHPHNKQDVGARLVRLALAQAYGRDVVYSGPVPASARAEGAALRVIFNHLGGGLVARNGPLQTFEIAGVDGNFVPATAAIEGDSVVVRSPEVSMPVAARYAWSNYPEGVNFYNAGGLPAAPFQIQARQP